MIDLKPLFSELRDSVQTEHASLLLIACDSVITLTLTTLYRNIQANFALSAPSFPFSFNPHLVFFHLLL